MNSFIRKHWFKIVGLAVVLAAAGTIAYQSLAPKGSPYPVDKAAADFQLTDLGGKKVSLHDYDNKVRLVYFFYSTCPDVCSPTSYILSQVQDELAKRNVFGSKTAIMSITFDPTRDTPEKLKEFSGWLHADPNGWLFLRGGEQEAIDLAYKYGVGVFKDKDGNFTHSNAIFLVDGKGNIRHYYAGSDKDLDKNKIVDDVLLMTKELK